tara:strand:+ start:3818 stop:3976 length:159 start_codon:yes stop_codon:yes gene_type:complete
MCDYDMKVIQEWVDKASCVDSAYERIAITQGMVTRPSFKENYDNPVFKYEED